MPLEGARGKGRDAGVARRAAHAAASRLGALPPVSGCRHCVLAGLPAAGDYRAELRGGGHCQDHGTARSLPAVRAPRPAPVPLRLLHRAHRHHAGHVSRRRPLIAAAQALRWCTCMLCAALQGWLLPAKAACACASAGPTCSQQPWPHRRSRRVDGGVPLHTALQDLDAWLRQQGLIGQVGGR